jgi:hypothetical protein
VDYEQKKLIPFHKITDLERTARILVVSTKESLDLCEFYGEMEKYRMECLIMPQKLDVLKRKLWRLKINLQ